MSAKPTLKYWELLWDATPSARIELQNSYQAICTLYPDGTISLKADPEGSFRVPLSYLWEMLAEAQQVARRYYGETWGA